MDTQLTRFERLLEEFKELEPSEISEPTIFSIGSKGYFENPTTDILAFFCDSNGQHQLGDVALKALLNCLPVEYCSLDSSLIEKPEREVRTAAGKRIDLLLESSDWVLVLENKINHQQNNPFEHYESFVREEQNQARFSDKQVLFVVLSPSGESLTKGWHGVSYPQLITELKAQLAEQFISQPINKWTLLLREFILHLESLMSQPSVNQQTLDFVINNLAAIKEVQETKKQAISEYHQQLQATIQSNIGKEVITRLEHWGGFPALRFYLSNWEEEVESDVVLLLSGDKAESSINTYAHLRNGVGESTADAIVASNISTERWVEGKHNQYRAYRVKSAEMTTEATIKYIGQRLLELNTFEHKCHGGMS
ncbi:PD-(D/E)XK nuclease family protein [Vibrio sp. 10N.222.49.C9]|uniref:PDDEXK-like family protein n=1 Tax=Vibrio sp. 10N.222.49.C9 TaxID=3229615 RepID=UPI00354D0744